MREFEERFLIGISLIALALIVIIVMLWQAVLSSVD